MISVKITLYNLSVELQSDANHPDALHDLTNRASAAFIQASATAKAQGIDLYNFGDIEEDELEN
jgi:hypothetical protein